MIHQHDRRASPAFASPPMTCADAAAANAEGFPVGSIAYLKSGGPPMTVHSTSPSDVTCLWFTPGGALEEQDFAPAVLTQNEHPAWGVPF